METEGTQEIINGYLNGGLFRNEYSVFADDSDFDLDSLVDPLDDSVEVGRSASMVLTSPPTPQESPLKMHFDRLRGSPPKPRRSPYKVTVEDSPFTLDDIELETHKTVKNIPSYIPSSKEFEKYSALLASSTDKIVKQLSAERAKNKELQRKVAELQNERFDAKTRDSDYALLKRQYALLRQEKEQLQRKSTQQSGQSDSLLVRENDLLRQKLIKYKSLYEASRAGQEHAPRSEPLHPRGEERDNRAPHGLNAPKYVHSANDCQRHSPNRATGSPQQPLQGDLVAALQQTLAQLTQLMPNTGTTRPSSRTYEPVSSTLPQTAEGDAGGQARHEKSVQGPPGYQSSEQRQLDHMAELMAKISHSISTISTTLQAAHCDKPECRACSAASSRPPLASTPQEHTHNLMGRYSWNRTV